VDVGYAGYRVFYDANSDGLPDYCRLVGDGTSKFFACLLTTASGFSSDQYGTTIQCPCWTATSFQTYFGSSPTCSNSNGGTPYIQGPEVSGPCQFGISGTCYTAVEAALGGALTIAAEAGRFDVVAQLAKEMEARRLSRAGNVVPIGGERAKSRR
jgi:hypothetical protein